MSRKEMEIESTYATLDDDDFTADDRAEYEAWLDSLPQAEMEPEDFDPADLPF